MTLNAPWFIVPLLSATNILLVTACGAQVSPTVEANPDLTAQLETDLEAEGGQPSSPDQSAITLSFTGENTGGDPVPEARGALQRYPGLESAATQVVIANNIPGHDAEQIDLEVAADGSKAKMKFIFSEGFVHPVYGSQARVREVNCSRSQQTEWNCIEIEGL